MFKIKGTKSQGCCYCDKCKLVNNSKINILKYNEEYVDAKYIASDNTIFIVVNVSLNVLKFPLWDNNS